MESTAAAARDCINNSISADIASKRFFARTSIVMYIRTREQPVRNKVRDIRRQIEEEGEKEAGEVKKKCEPKIAISWLESI